MFSCLNITSSIFFIQMIRNVYKVIIYLFTINIELINLDAHLKSSFSSNDSGIDQAKLKQYVSANRVSPIKR